MIGLIAADDATAARRLREAEQAIQAIDGVTLLDGDFLEETYRRDDGGQDVRVHLDAPSPDPSDPA